MNEYKSKDETDPTFGIGDMILIADRYSKYI